MQSRKTITIVTSPPTTTAALPSFASCSSPTISRAPVKYRIEERSRTVYVTSDVTPSEWDPKSINTLFSLAEGPEGTQADEEAQSVRRTSSKIETEYIITEELPGPAPQETRSAPPRLGGHHPQRSSPQTPPRRQPNRGPFASSESPRKTIYLKPNQVRPRILFYHKHDPHYGFTNFSAHPVMYNGKKYPTSEHLFQSFKFQDHRPNLAEHIRTCSERPSVAFSEARRFQPEVRGDWKHVNIKKMEEAIWHKFTQHADLRAELLATGDAELVEDSDKDAFWGVGADGQGRNELGKALERLRSKLRSSGW